MKLVHGKSGRFLEASMVPNPDGELLLATENRIFTPLEALEESLVLLDATDAERQALVDAGYALPSEVVQLREDDVE